MFRALKYLENSVYNYMPGLIATEVHGVDRSECRITILHKLTAGKIRGLAG